MTAPHTLYWTVLRLNFDVEHVHVILGHNVEYTRSMSRLPSLVLECWKGMLGVEGMPNRTEMKGVKVDEMDWPFMEQSQALGPSFPPGFTPRVHFPTASLTNRMWSSCNSLLLTSCVTTLKLKRCPLMHSSLHLTVTPGGHAQTTWSLMLACFGRITDKSY